MATKKHVHHHRHIKQKKHGWTAKSPSIVSPKVQQALRDAMVKEQIPTTEFDDLLWIVAQESEGVVNAKNGSSTARGLFQLLKMQYGLNPNGEKSFGDAVEESQGGIHYIMGRYHTAAAARKHWEKHHWY